MMRLLYLAHATAEVLPIYKAALPPDVDVVAFVGPPLPNVEGGGMSSRYAALGQQLRAANGGRVLPGLLKKYPPPKPAAEYDEIWMATWSAGYALPREFSAHDRAALTGLVLLDSGHTDKDPDGTARDAGVAWAVVWAKLARDGFKTFAIGHSDVKTYGTTASTTQFAAEVALLAGGIDGRFTVEAFDVSKSDHDEHIAALRGWGPAFVAAAMGAAPAEADTEPPPAEPAPPTDRSVGGHELPRLTLGERLVAWYHAEIAAGTREIPPGSNTSPRIKEFLAPCRRRATEQLLHLTAAEWCCAMYCKGCEETAEPGEAYPAPRAAGVELEDDHRETGTFLPIAEVLAGGEQPELGDAAIYRRGTTAWQRHIACVVVLPDATGAYVTAGGNEENRVKETMRSLHDPDLLGFGVLRRRRPVT